MKYEITKAELDTQVTPISEAVENLVIENNEQFANTGAILQKIKVAEKIVKTKKEEITKPLNAQLKEARAFFKPFEEALENAKRGTQAKMTEFKREQDRIAAEKAKKLEEKIEKGTIKKPETIMKNVNQIAEIGADMINAGVKETTRTIVKIDFKGLDPAYLKELINRPRIVEALEKEIRADALGNKTQGIEPRVEKGVEVVQEKVII